MVNETPNTEFPSPNNSQPPTHPQIPTPSAITLSRKGSDMIPPADLKDKAQGEGSAVNKEVSYTYLSRQSKLQLLR
jgi:hypothetical protein